MSAGSWIADLLKAWRFRLGSEAALQADIWSVLRDLDADVDREVRLAPGERIDFMVDGVGIEAKVKCPKRHIYRQLERYAKVDRIDELVLITATPLGLPPTILGKPVFYVSLGRTAL